jgi:hypothetical protein
VPIAGNPLRAAGESDRPARLRRREGLSMAVDALSQRRRAAVAVLGSLLDETTLLQELWFQHDSMRGEAVSDIIAFVDAVAGRHLFDAATCRRLYSDFYKALRETDARLPLDPWPAMQALRAPPPAPAAPRWAMAASGAAPLGVPVAPVAAAMVAPTPVAALINPVAAALAAAQPAPAVAPAAPAAPPLAAEPPVVFGAVLRAVVAEVYQFHRDALDEVRKDALAVLDSARATPPLREAFRDAWPRALQHDWQLRGSHADLAELMRVVYHALGAAFGRVGADQILQRAIQVAEGLPEARRFSPKRLLAAL